MIAVDKNIEFNRGLSALYEEKTKDFLCEWRKAFQGSAPPRLNVFGIIDEEKYDADNGILFIGKETNEWDDKDFAAENFFRPWLRSISLHGLEGHGSVKTHPNMWYNVGRWAMLLQQPERDLQEIANQKYAALEALGTIAFTNINKARGKNASKKEYYKLAYSEIAGSVLKKELDILKPSTIVCCGTYREFVHHISDYPGKIIDMPHPAARKSKLSLLNELRSQISLL